MGPTSARTSASDSLPAPLALRYHGLDAVRGIMLLLGIALHLSVPYSGLPTHGFFVSEQRSGLIVLAVVIVHHFRLPVFFLMAGFFSGHLFHRRGARSFVITRIKQIGVVWLVSLALLYPIVALVSIYNHFACVDDAPWIRTVKSIQSRQWESNWLLPGPIHLWFLEYLLLFCLVAALLRPTSVPPALDRWTGDALCSRFRAFYFAIPTIASLTFFPLAFVPYPDSFIPSVSIALVYGWPFSAGWLIYRRRDLFPKLACETRVELWTLPIALAAGFVFARQRSLRGLNSQAVVADVTVAFCTAVFIWCSVFALIGRAASARESPWIRYLADSSYWMYLMHLPLALLIPALLRGWEVPPAVKIALGWAAILAVLLFTYERFVRYTFVGRVLRGRFVFREPSPPAAATCTAEAAPAVER
ncbi:MAG TPA: acyltransferase family protein [Bryobacteraceae bacterium]|nr:acyltransferase family protein [Bryobacteraceae bacterium]